MNLTNTTMPCANETLFADSVAVKAIKTAAYSILLLLSLFGNSMVPAVVYRNPELHTSVNYFIASMSISDLLIPIFALPERIKEIFIPSDIWQIDGIFGLLVCKLRAFAIDTSIILTVITLVIVSLERFFAVKYPFKTQPLRNKKSCFIVILLIWMFAMIYSSSNFYSWRLTTVNNTTSCVRSWETPEADTIEYIVFQVLFIIIPVFILIIVYSIMIVLFQRKKFPGQLELRQRREKAKIYRRITYMLLTVMLVFFIPVTSTTVFRFLSAFVWTESQLCRSRQVTFTLRYLDYICQAFNPYIYCIFNKRYSDGFKNIFCSATKSNCCKKTKGDAQKGFLIQTRQHRFPQSKNVTSTTAVKMTLLMTSSV